MSREDSGRDESIWIFGIRISGIFTRIGRLVFFVVFEAAVVVFFGSLKGFGVFLMFFVGFFVIFGFFVGLKGFVVLFVFFVGLAKIEMKRLTQDHNRNE